jgi:hypothetical protein
MKIIVMTALGIAVALSPLAALGQTKSFSAGVAIFGASLNPPNPIEGCDKAKKAATENAAKAGFKGAVTWDHLSTDSDCKLTTHRAGNAGVSFVFTATGKFSKE